MSFKIYINVCKFEEVYPKYTKWKQINETNWELNKFNNSNDDPKQFVMILPENQNKYSMYVSINKMIYTTISHGDFLSRDEVISVCNLCLWQQAKIVYYSPLGEIKEFEGRWRPDAVSMYYDISPFEKYMKSQIGKLTKPAKY